jgi:antagonist of KipI
VTSVLRVGEPGLFTTIQDLGRLNAIAGGVPPGGAMDRFAHRAANALVGNDHHEATLECTISGPTLTAEQPCLLAITGADFDPRVNGAPAPMWTGMLLARGDRLSFGGRRSGARAYIAVAGGFDGERWLGSRSTSIMAGRGGMGGRALVAGDVLTTAGERLGPSVAGRHLRADQRPEYGDQTLAVLAGPHLRRLGPESRKSMFSSPFSVRPDSDRMGYRLEGPGLKTSGEELLSFGLVAGAVQVPHSGQPIMLMADHQTAGGYPVVATVISASLPIAAQLVPGAELRFVEVTARQAGVRRAALSAALSSVEAPRST